MGRRATEGCNISIMVNITSSAISLVAVTQNQTVTPSASKSAQCLVPASVLSLSNPDSASPQVTSRSPEIQALPTPASNQANPLITAPQTSSDNPAKKNSRSTTENQHYDPDTVLILLSMMNKAGYGDRKKQKNSLKDVFIKATELAEKHHVVKRSAKAWQKKFTRMKQEYFAFIGKISESGRDGDDPDLYDKPDFYEQMHELERGKARHDPPAIFCSENGSAVSDLPLTSTRKKAKLSHSMLLETFIEDQTKRQDALLEEIKKGNEEKAR